MKNSKLKQRMHFETSSKIKSSIYKVLEAQLIEDVFRACKDLLQQWSSKALVEWLEVFGEALKAINFNNIKKECINLVLLLSEMSQPLESKMCAAKLYEYLCNVMPTKDYEAFIQNIRNLSHDFNWQVRKSMCESLVHIIDVYKDTDLGKDFFLEEIFDLVIDYEEEVRCTGVITFLTCFGYFMKMHSKQIYTIMKGIFLKMTEKISAQIAERLGTLIMGVCYVIRC
jgi:hypothetical protein